MFSRTLLANSQPNRAGVEQLAQRMELGFRPKRPEGINLQVGQEVVADKELEGTTFTMQFVWRVWLNLCAGTHDQSVGGVSKLEAKI